MTVAVVKEGRVVLSKGFGMANLEYDIPLTPATILNIGSVSKQFTALAIFMLQDQGKLSIEDDIRDHIPYVPDLGAKITIRHLIHHSSGLRENLNGLILAGWGVEDVMTLEHTVQFISRMQERNFAPGDEYLYCNTGYCLLAEIVAEVAGEPFSAWVRKNIFQPLGMNSSFVDDDLFLPRKGKAYSYGPRENGGGGELNYAPIFEYVVGAGGIHSTVEDLAKWLENYRTLVVGSPSIMAAMIKVCVLNSGEASNYAGGLLINQYRGKDRIGHNGAHGGFRAGVVVFPELKTGIAVLSNWAGFYSDGLLETLADIYLDDHFDQPSTGSLNGSEPSVAFDPAKFDEYAGEYEMAIDLSVIMKFIQLNGRYFLQITGSPRFEIFPSAKDTFNWPAARGQIEFNRDSKGRVNSLTMQLITEQTAQRVQQMELEPAALKGFTGRYFSPELETVYSLFVEEDKLVVKHQRHEPITLKPHSEDTFRGSVWFFSEVAFERDDSGAVNVMRVGNGRVRNMRFTKQ